MLSEWVNSRYEHLAKMAGGAAAPAEEKAAE